jgi:diguanylate cyclase (GGDEF)-like protein
MYPYAAMYFYNYATIEWMGCQPMKMKSNRVITVLSIPVFCCLLLSTILSLVSIRKISQEHTSTLLEALSNEVYHSINDELTESIHVSSTIANDTFVLELLENEASLDPEFLANQLKTYTQRLKNSFDYSWVFIVSDQTKAYYSDSGIYRAIDPDNQEDDAWYNEFLALNRPYNVTLGQDSDLNVWTVFADARIESESGEFLGVCGIAMEIHDLQTLIADFETQYDISILFLDSNGDVQIESDSLSDSESPKYLLGEQTDLSQISVNRSKGHTTYTITKYIEKLDWYMVIEDIDPYNYTPDYLLLLLNTAAFVLFILITAVCLRYITAHAGSLFSDSYRDSMTGMFNRRAFNDDTEHLRHRELPKRLAVAIFDVNGLKTLNDTCGHASGDELIIGAAKVIQEVFSPYGKCYRIGGDEFAAILDAPISDSAGLSTQFDTALAAWHGKTVEKLEVSYGIAYSEGAERTIDDLLYFADEQMYANKEAYYTTTGKDRRKH